MLKFDKQKYYRILKSEGVQKALTELHRDTGQWEYVTFEGEEGYQPQMWEELKVVRVFSRELWAMALDPGHPSFKRV